jgi:OmcA/MtrC family decaheme c-type cytochrome
MRVIEVLGALLLAGLLIGFTTSSASAQGVAPGLNVSVNSVSFSPDGRPEVNFSSTDDLGISLALEEFSDVRFILGFLATPPGTVTARYTSYTTRTEASALQADYDSARLSGVTKNIDGTFTYKFATAIPPGFDRTATHQIAGQFRRVFAVDGETYRANVAQAFRPDGQAVSETREVVETATCNNCHTRLSEHGDIRREVQLCIMCHNRQTVDAETENELDYPVMIHKIHRGANLRSFVQDGVPYQISGYQDRLFDYSTVQFPQEIRNCEVCHKSSFHLENPTIAGCGSCHDRTWFGDPTQLPAGYTTHPIPGVMDTECKNCHQPGVVDIDVSHLTEEELFGPGLALDILDVLTMNTSNDDSDGDEIQDGEDNCVVVANPMQEDTDQDGIGDACECGDESGDGVVNSTDARLIQRCAVGEIACTGLCDVTGENDCNTTDSRLIQRLVVGQITKKDLSCDERPAAAAVAIANDGSAEASLQIVFSAKDGTGVALSVFNADTMNIVAATVAWPAPEYENDVLENIFSSFGQPPDGTLVNNGGGLYTYTFATTLPGGSTDTFAVAMEGRRPYSPIGGVTTLQQGTATNGLTFFTLDGSEPATRRALVDEADCQVCHEEIRAHGELRAGVDFCVMCHNPNETDQARRPAEQLPPATVHFKTLIHKVHSGEDLTGEYTVYGSGGNPHDFTEVRFPGEKQQCSICHVPGATDLPLPIEALSTLVTQDDGMEGEELVSETLPERAACRGCHDDLLTDVHALRQTDLEQGVESCAVCHGPGSAFAVGLVHQLGP